MALSQNQLKHRCLSGAGARQCRYLKSLGWQQGECEKLLAGRKKAIDDKTKKHIEACRKNHVDPNHQWVPIGDGGSCPGYLYLLTVVQGYDQKPQKK